MKDLLNYYICWFYFIRNSSLLLKVLLKYYKYFKIYFNCKNQKKKKKSNKSGNCSHPTITNYQTNSTGDTSASTSMNIDQESTPGDRRITVKLLLNDKVKPPEEVENLPLEDPNKYGRLRDNPFKNIGIKNIFFFSTIKKYKKNENYGKKEIPITCTLCEERMNREKHVKDNKQYQNLRCSRCKTYVTAANFKAYLVYLYYRGIVTITGDSDENYKIIFKDLQTNEIAEEYKFYNPFLESPNSIPYLSPGGKKMTFKDIKRIIQCSHDKPNYGHFVDDKYTTKCLLYSDYYMYVSR